MRVGPPVTRNLGEGDAVQGDHTVESERDHVSAGRAVTDIASAAQNIAVDHGGHREKKKRAENQLEEMKVGIGTEMRTEVSAVDGKRTAKTGERQVTMGWKLSSEFQIVFIFKECNQTTTSRVVHRAGLAVSHHFH